MKRVFLFLSFFVIVTRFFAMSVYFNSPPHESELKSSLVRLLESAEFSIDISIYNVNDEEIISLLRRKEKSGVTVRIVMEGKNYISKMNTLRELDVVADPLDNGLMHEKFAIVDGEWVWVGSANFTTSSFEGDFNNAVVMHSAKVAGFFEREFELLYSGFFSETVFPRLFEVDNVKVWVGFSPSKDVFNEVLKALLSAKRDVYIAMFAFSDWRLALTLAWLDERGVRIHVIVDSKWNISSYSVLKDMKEFDFKSCENPYGLIHDKYIIVDPHSPNAVVVTGSYNLTKSAQTRNDEVVLILHSHEIAALYLKNFMKLSTLVGGK